jgi:hypothetical protein
MAKEVKTEAMKNFEANLGPLRLLIGRLEAQRMVRAGTAAIEEITRWEKASFQDTSALEQATAKVASTIGEYVTLQALVFSWMSVMLVTFLEAYLEEGLITLAERNPKLLEHAPPIQPARLLEVGSIEELRAETRQQWAAGVMRPGGPEKWVGTLKNLGARGYDNKACQGVQHLWDTRNLIVHSRSIASVAYARKYDAMGMKAGAKVNVNGALFGSWLDPLKSFMSCTDAFFLRYKQP